MNNKEGLILQGCGGEVKEWVDGIDVYKRQESEYLKQLEDENLRLRIENAYLKELRRLSLEEEKPPKNRQE